MNDLTSECDNSPNWGFYLYSKVVTATQCSNFTIYYFDGFEIITTWFPSYILRNNVSLSLLARGATVDAAVRECREETGVILNPDMVHFMNYNDDPK